MSFGKSGGLGVLLCCALDFAVAALLNAYDIPLADEGVEVVGDGPIRNLCRSRFLSHAKFTKSTKITHRKLAWPSGW